MNRQNWRITFPVPVVLEAARKRQAPLAVHVSKTEAALKEFELKDLYQAASHLHLSSELDWGRTNLSEIESWIRFLSSGSGDSVVDLDREDFEYFKLGEETK